MVTVDLRVNFFDTDAMGVVHHANYIRWFEIGRVEYLRSIGITLEALMEDGFLFPITEVSAKYVSPGHFDDELCVETKASRLTKAKMVFRYRIFRKSDGVTLAEGRTQNVFTNRETGHIARLPEKYYTLLEKAMADEEKNFSDTKGEQSR